jgi:fatty-acyl-CoA synthase
MRPVDFLYRGALRFPNATAVVSGSRRVSYRELVDAVNALAVALQDCDPTVGSRVALLGSNSIDYLVGLLATLAAGKTWVPFLPSNGRAEAQRIVEFTEASIVLGDDAGLSLLGGDTPARSTFCLAERGGGSTGSLIDKWRGQVPVALARHPDDTAAIKFTGGSTGTPKGVMQPDRAWVAYTAMLIHHLGFTPSERTLIATPMTHGVSVFLLPTLATGGLLEIHCQARAPEMVAALASGVARTFAPPALINRMCADGGASPDRFPYLRQILYSAAPMASGDIAATQRSFGPRLATAYGQTEAPLMITYCSPEEMAEPDRAATVGRDALMSRSGIVGAGGQMVGANEVGEICVRGPLVMTGYWRRPDLTETAFVDGWLRTGDLGSRDEQGYIAIRGRVREMINSGGFKVFPSDVETALRAHPDVADCAVFGRTDPGWGEAVAAIVVPRESSARDPEALKAHVRAMLGPVRTPKTVEFRTEVPRNAQGKIQRHLLAAEDGHA